MATRKMTFSLPKDLAAQFSRRVHPRERSRYVAEALAAKLKERELQLARACDVANRDRKARAIEREFDRLVEEIAEPWHDASSR